MRWAECAGDGDEAEVAVNIRSFGPAGCLGNIALPMERAACGFLDVVEVVVRVVLIGSACVHARRCDMLESLGGNLAGVSPPRGWGSGCPGVHSDDLCCSMLIATPRCRSLIVMMYGSSVASHDPITRCGISTSSSRSAPYSLPPT